MDFVIGAEKIIITHCITGSSENAEKLFIMMKKYPLNMQENINHILEAILEQ